MQDSEVGKTDEHFRLLTNKGEVQVRQEPQAAVSTAHRQDGLNLRVAPEIVQLGQPFLVGPGQVAVVPEDVVPVSDLESQIAENLQPGAEIAFVAHRTGRGDDADGIPFFQGGGEDGLKRCVHGAVAGR